MLKMRKALPNKLTFQYSFYACVHIPPFLLYKHQIDPILSPSPPDWRGKEMV
ncbi:MAG: hypothetical protein AOA65_1278 [Candidatus Bathyarchaeota archaeon BA1]|nr:MAG: hypothetical protein AOA65_1278 [Candidatus Bathyarchaeota archaeon BA1]